ncbi:MAG: hypothetical protein ABI981_11380 [Betaproteobacteria bacterium]
MNSRTFSIAITPWSTKDFASAISLSVKAPATARCSTSTPIHSSSRSIGSISDDLFPIACWMRCSCSGRSMADQSGMCRGVLLTNTRDGKLAAGSMGTTDGPTAALGKPCVPAAATGENVLPSRSNTAV